MSTQKHNRPAPSQKTRSWSQAGMTLLEGLVVVGIIAVIAGVVIPTIYEEFEKAKLATCFSEISGMQAVAVDLGDGRYVPTPDQFWNEGYPSSTEGEYYYIVDSEDHNKGHGNDLDFCDEDNPNWETFKGCPGAGNIKWVVLCSHDHGRFGKYCYATDVDPPQIATEDDDPGYYAFLDMPNNDGTLKEGKKPKKAAKK